MNFQFALHRARTTELWREEERRNGFCLVTETASGSPESPRTPRRCLVSSANEWPNEFRKTPACSAISLPSFSTILSTGEFIYVLKWFLSGSLFLSVGLTWEDDTTQQVLSKELSKLRSVPYRPQQSGPVYNTNSRSDVYPTKWQKKRITWLTSCEACNEKRKGFGERGNLLFLLVKENWGVGRSTESCHLCCSSALRWDFMLLEVLCVVTLFAEYSL